MVNERARKRSATHEACNVQRKAQHKNSIQGTDVYAQLKGVGGNNTQQLSTERLAFNFTAILARSQYGNFAEPQI